jgi:CheY-like chemotaxis protein
MSHEIRTPMNGILGFATLLKKPSLSNEKQNKYIKAIEQSGKRMLNIINDIIDISRIEAGQTEINIETTDIYKVVDDLFTFFKPEAFDKKIEIHLNILEEHKNCVIETDKNKLIQILTNLIKNGLKFTQNGKVEFGYKIRGNFVQFYVSDTGIGVPAEMQTKIFERFRQVETNMASKYEGAGLGLSISKAFVELLGGTIWLESEPNKGSTFYFTIPLINPLEKSLSADERISENLLKIEGKKTFLIAEDDEPSFLYLSDLIENDSIIIKRAYNGKDVISQVAEHPEIDIILMDIKMPEMDGYQAIKIVKAMRPELPVIAQTAFVMMNDKKKALSSGFDDYLSKPIQVEELNLIFAKYL